MFFQNGGSIEVEQNVLFRNIKGVMIIIGIICSCLKDLVYSLMMKFNSENVSVVRIRKVSIQKGCVMWMLLNQKLVSRIISVISIVLVVVVLINFSVILIQLVGVIRNLQIVFENFGKQMLKLVLLIDCCNMVSIIRFGMMKVLQVMFLIDWMCLLMVVLKIMKYRIVDRIGEVSD